MLLSVTPNVEFLWKENKSIKLNFYKDDKIVTSGVDSVRLLIDGELVEVTQKEGAYVSGPLELKFPVSVIISVKEKSEKYTEEFSLEDDQCVDCGRAEYVCTCENHEH